MIIEWIFLSLFVIIAGLIWCLPFLMWVIYSYDTKTDQLKKKNNEWNSTRVSGDMRDVHDVLEALDAYIEAKLKEKNA